MLISDDGKWVGSISGGCLEGDALRKARKVMSEKKPLMVTYDTSEDSNQNLGIGLGCNGIIDVLIEPVAHEDAGRNPISLFERLLSYKEPVALATVFSNTRFQAEKLLVNGTGDVIIPFSSDRLSALVRPDLENLFESRRSEVRTYDYEGDTIEVFVELIQPSVSLMIFGGGFDARPVSQMAKSLGWKVTVTDKCVAHIAPVFFPSADKLSLCQRDFIDRDFDITPFTSAYSVRANALIKWLRNLQQQASI
jgi:xanthine/CO dehydrogenase XdhC/CoxF family maturation factor